MARTSGGIIVPNAYGNPIINGGFEIWQRGTSFVSPANAAYLADRFRYEKSGSFTHTVTQDTDVPAVAALIPFSNYSIKLNVTGEQNSPGSSDYSALSYSMEGFDYAAYASKQITVGFWVKFGKAGIYTLAIWNHGYDRCYLNEFTVNAADTWEYKTVTFTGFSSGAGTMNLTTGAGIRLAWTFMAGSSLKNTAGSTLYTSQYFGSSNQVNAVETGMSGKNFKLWGVTMGLGPTVAPYWPRLYADELQLCQRYYYTFSDLVAVAVCPDEFTNGWIEHRRYLPSTLRANITPTGTVQVDLSINASAPNQNESGWTVSPLHSIDGQQYRYRAGKVGATGTRGLWLTSIVCNAEL